MNDVRTVRVSESDLPESVIEDALTTGVVAWDIETSGLDWRTERIATCQVAVPGRGVDVVRLLDKVPHRLVLLLESPDVRKVFHHARFDLRFMCSHWKAEATQVACTKVAAKLLRPDRQPGAHSLQTLVREYLGVSLDKAEQLSDWFREDLTDGQLSYAAGDVIYLAPLLEALMVQLRSRGLAHLAEACFAHLPTRVELDLRGYQDVFAY